jgi:hypothetical protein
MHPRCCRQARRVLQAVRFGVCFGRCVVWAGGRVVASPAGLPRPACLTAVFTPLGKRRNGYPATIFDPASNHKESFHDTDSHLLLRMEHFINHLAREGDVVVLIAGEPPRL